MINCQMGELAQVEELLKHMLQPNTDVVRQATQALNKVLKQQTSIPLLLELTFKNPHAEVHSFPHLQFDTPSDSSNCRCISSHENHWTLGQTLQRRSRKHKEGSFTLIIK